MFTSIGVIAGRYEEVVTFVWCEERANVPYGAPEIFICSSSDLSYECFELRECHLNGVQVGAVLWQEQEPGTDFFQGRGGLGASVCGEIVEDDHITRPERWGKNAFDIEFECFLIHGTVDDAGRIDPVVPQAGDERLRVPMATRGMIDQPRP